MERRSAIVFGLALIAVVAALASAHHVGLLVHDSGQSIGSPSHGSTIPTEGRDGSRGRETVRSERTAERGGLFDWAGGNPVRDLGNPSSGEWTDRSIPVHELSPVQAGKRLTEGNCEGRGAGTLTHPPMDPEDIGVIIPYGSTVNAHVTPIDHWYFYPEEFESAPDTYPVYAMSDGHIYLLDYAPPNQVEDTGATRGDYGVYITVSCTHLYYETLLSSLSPRLEAIFEEQRRGNRAYVYVPVEAGELIGRIGGQTIDYAVLDTTRPLDGFVSPELYVTEPAKIYTADPYEYASADLRETLIRKNPRTARPLGGRIDYDLAGRLRGNWFLEGTNGYRGGPIGEEPPRDYWTNHLAVYPDHFDPGVTVISVGDFRGEPRQLATPPDSPDPATVGVGDGPIEFTLTDLEYMNPDGTAWDGVSATERLSVSTGVDRGCALFEMPANRTLHAEFFPGQSCSTVDGFTGAMRVYER